MDTNTLTLPTATDRCFSEEELIEMGLEYTYQNFSKYLIYRKGNSYYLLNEVEQDQFMIEFNFEEN